MRGFAFLSSDLVAWPETDKMDALQKHAQVFGICAGVITHISDGDVLARLYCGKILFIALTTDNCCFSATG